MFLLFASEQSSWVSEPVWFLTRLSDFLIYYIRLIPAGLTEKNYFVTAIMRVAMDMRALVMLNKAEVLAEKKALRASALWGST